jgi:NADH-quinone oxidoreductase subunit M
MDLSRAIPFAAATFTIASVASMGLPGFSGFVAELQVLIGAWQAFPTLVVVAGTGILVGVAYTMRVLQKAFFADRERGRITAATASNGRMEMPPISVPERIGAMMLMGTSLAIGIWPGLLLQLIVPSFSSPLFDGLRKVAGE